LTGLGEAHLTILSVGINLDEVCGGVKQVLVYFGGYSGIGATSRIYRGGNRASVPNSGDSIGNVCNSSVLLRQVVFGVA